MRKPIQIGLFACIMIIAIVALLWVNGRRARRGSELGENGGVVVTGDGETAFGSSYREAIDLVAKGKIAEAEKVYMDLTNKEPSSANGYVGLGSCCLERNDVIGARKLYQIALGLEPKSVNALVGMGSSYSIELDYTNAATNYEQALAVDERSPEAHWGLAIAYAEMGRRGDAVNHLSRFKELAPDSQHIAGLEEYIGAAKGRPAIRSGTKRMSPASDSPR